MADMFPGSGLNMNVRNEARALQCDEKSSMPDFFVSSRLVSLDVPSVATVGNDNWSGSSPGQDTARIYSTVVS